MVFINSVALIGRLTREPELKYLQSGTAVCNFTLAVDKGLSKDKKQELENKGRPTADFIRIKVWGKQAENCANYCYKGQRVAVSGSIRTSTSKNDDGSTNYYTDVNAYRVEFLEYKSDDSNGKDNSNVSADDFKSMEEDDDVPF